MTATRRHSEPHRTNAAAPGQRGKGKKKTPPRTAGERHADRQQAGAKPRAWMPGRGATRPGPSRRPRGAISSPGDARGYSRELATAAPERSGATSQGASRRAEEETSRGDCPTPARGLGLRAGVSPPEGRDPCPSRAGRVHFAVESEVAYGCSVHPSQGC